MKLFAFVVAVEALLRGAGPDSASSDYPPRLNCTITNVAVALYQGERILVLKRGSAEAALGEHGHVGEWNLPGGGIEDGETAEHAALRECSEEADVQLSKTVHWQDFLFAPNRCISVWQAEVEDVAVHIDSSSSAFTWIAKDELPDYIFLEPQQKVLAAAFQHRMGSAGSSEASPSIPGRPWGSTNGSLEGLPLD